MFANDKELRPSAITNYPARETRLFNEMYKWGPLYKAIKGADIVHINGYTAIGTVQALLLSHLLRKKIVYTAHWHPFEMLSRPTGGKLFFNIFLKPLIKRWADDVICINAEDTGFFSKFCKNTTTIPHWFTPRIQRAEYKKKKNMILFVGRVNDQVKGIHHLFALPEGKYDIHCVGFGDFKSKRGDMTHHMNISDSELYELYSEASLVVIPSRYEAFSYVALEAFSFGTPVVMSERVRIADYLKGLHGYSIFKYGDEGDFVDKVEKTIGASVDKDMIMKIFDYNRIKGLYKTVYIQKS